MLVQAPAADSTAALPGTPGHGIVSVEHLDGASVVTRARAASPLRLLTPRNHGRAAWVYLASYGGGLLDGDALHVDLQVGPHAAAMIATQAWTKVFRTKGDPSRGASASIAAAVGAHGRLLLLPDPVVCFAGSRLDRYDFRRATIRVGSSS